MPDLEHGFDNAVIVSHDVRRSLKSTSHLKKREVPR